MNLFLYICIIILNSLPNANSPVINKIIQNDLNTQHNSGMTLIAALQVRHTCPSQSIPDNILMVLKR